MQESSADAAHGASTAVKERIGESFTYRGATPKKNGLHIMKDRKLSTKYILTYAYFVKILFILDFLITKVYLK